MVKNQQTIKQPVSYSGIGLHTGNKTKACVYVLISQPILIMYMTTYTQLYIISVIT